MHSLVDYKESNQHKQLNFMEPFTTEPTISNQAAAIQQYNTIIWSTSIQCDYDTK